MKVKFVIPGEPKGKGRPRFSRSGQYVGAYTPEATASYENLVKIEYQRQSKGVRFDDKAMLEMYIEAYYTIPKSASKKKKTMMLEGEIRPTKKLVMDTIIRIIADSLNGLASRNAIRIVPCGFRKFYDEFPRVEVTLVC